MTFARITEITKRHYATRDYSRHYFAMSPGLIDRVKNAFSPTERDENVPEYCNTFMGYPLLMLMGIPIVPDETVAANEWQLCSFKEMSPVECGVVDLAETLIAAAASDVASAE